MKKLLEELHQLDEFVEVIDPNEIEMAARFLINFSRRFSGPLSQDWRAYASQAKELLSKLKESKAINERAMPMMMGFDGGDIILRSDEGGSQKLLMDRGQQIMDIVRKSMGTSKRLTITIED
jgi:hypothetical protein